MIRTEDIRRQHISTVHFVQEYVAVLKVSMADHYASMS